MRRVYPHEYFKLDFDKMLEEGRRQERIHPANVGEAAVVDGLHNYFDDVVLPMIREQDWVYEAASTFTERYAMDCFHVLRLNGKQLYDTQQQLLALNQRVEDFLVYAAQEHALRIGRFREVEEMLSKASDFFSYIKLYALNNAKRREAQQLYEEAVDHESLQVKATLQGIRVVYETSLPRIMYIVRRVIKLQKGLAPEVRDDELAGVSDDISWYKERIREGHPLYPVFGELQSFYKHARNAASHHEGVIWRPEQNEVVLVDRRYCLPPMHMHRFQQLYRYLADLCEIGLRGILTGYCERERGHVSNSLAKKYMQTFPEDFSGGEPGVLILYPERNHPELVDN